MIGGQPAHLFLEEFAGDTSAGRFDPLPFLPRIAEPPLRPDAAEQRVAEAFAHGLAEGRAIERARADAELTQAATDFEARLEHMQSAFSKELMERLSREIEIGFERSRSIIFARLASALLPVLRYAIAEAAIRSFAGEVARLLDEPAAGIAEVSGPADLLERIRSHAEASRGMATAPWTGRIRLVPGSSPDVRMIIDDTIIETRIADWVARIEEALG